MATDPLISAQAAVDEARLAAGRDYVAALDALGVVVDAAMWGVDAQDRPQLLLITSLFDRIGPLTVYNALFRAYDLARTPQEVDPWEISVHSPKTEFARQFRTGNILAPMPVTVNFSDGSKKDVGLPWMNFSEYRIRADWIIRDLDGERVDPDVAVRRWHRFESNLAAA